MDQVIQHWTEIVVAIAAVAALIVALVSLRVSSRALRLSEEQERRKEPRLIPALLDSHFESIGTDRVYSFSLSVRNPTDSDNAIAQMEMYLHYLINGSTPITVKLPPCTATVSANKRTPRLDIPCRIAAHDAVSGWCDFVVKFDLLHGRDIEGYQIVVTDSQLTEAVIDPILVAEKRHAV